ncbi:hypothetical protein C3942_00775 [Solimonas fluminis]|uniref:Virulence-associated protein E-like domain-containing protein n=1 Tax=Solimonas fluminis TaxID=2086571 RepID=A0A2S5TKJ6_9GAMM|nr:VapE domain-containing protein [Solimonas fluminis]PPE75462.1 hypothetical protein C3942_00775 [Solimonas fluminis]
MSEALDPVQSALDELRGFGLVVDRLLLGPPASGKVHRVDVEGQKRGKKAGWYIAYEVLLDDGRRVVVGSYGIWQGSESNAQKFKIRGGKLDESARARVQERQKQLAAEAERAEHDLLREVQKRAAEIWKQLPGDSIRSPYLQAKGVRPYGLRQARDGGIVVPARNTAGMITQLQFISGDGGKKFLTGPGKKGSFHMLGAVANEKPLVFAEGYATGATIHEATDWPVVVCFDSGNVLVVAKLLRVVYPDVRFIFAGDDDHEKKENAGLKTATEGAKAFKGAMVMPRFEDPAGKTDFNDMAAEQGLAAVKERLLKAWTPTLPAAPQGASTGSWKDELVWGDTGLKAMTHNVMLVLLNHEAWQGVLAFDQFAKRIVKRRPPPYGGEAGAMTDSDEIEMAAWFGRKDTFRIAVPTMVAREASIAVAKRFAFHPLRDWLDSLTWDGTERIPTFFSDFCGTDQTEMHKGFALNFFISSVARVRQPGCKADLMLVLEGEQGARKSTLVNMLFGDEYFADLGTPPSDKDFYVIIQGRWGVEIGELSSFAKAESSHIKRAVSSRIDRFRSPYGRNAEDYPRECIFVGTVNNSDWQRDETGGRRYMPVVVRDVNIDAIRDVREQLWAEADARFKRGEPWHILPEGAYEAQEQRYVEDIWAEQIYRWLEGKAAEDRYLARLGYYHRKPVEITTAADILLFALDVERKKQDKPLQTRVGNLMRRFGWGRQQKRLGATRVWQYTRPPEDAAKVET